MISMAKVNLRPLDDRVVVQPLEAEETTAGGIVLPDSAKEKPQRGKVVAVGPGKLLDSGNAVLSASLLATKLFSASTAEAKLKSMALSTRSFARAMFLQSWS
jgi:hypothetical protein